MGEHYGSQIRDRDGIKKTKEKTFNLRRIINYD